MKFIKRLSLCWRIMAHNEEGSLEQHATRELSTPQVDDEMQGLFNQQILEMIVVFSTHGHSGFSAGYARSTLHCLLNYEPLRPLLGTPDEWDIFNDSPTSPDESVAQNKRCGHVFLHADGTAWDNLGIIFQEPDGSCYTNRESLVKITFPYTPEPKYVERSSDE